mmetsp:Transcript_14131/g.34194  ORF Transcript_14131/g.34194 Transcript_14131/m.34194 type:complete len:272 (+) Transcript_14131:2290-3105(+)
MVDADTPAPVSAGVVILGSLEDWESKEEEEAGAGEGLSPVDAVDDADADKEADANADVDGDGDGDGEGDSNGRAECEGAMDAEEASAAVEESPPTPTPKRRKAPETPSEEEESLEAAAAVAVVEAERAAAALAAVTTPDPARQIFAGLKGALAMEIEQHPTDCELPSLLREVCGAAWRQRARTVLSSGIHPPLAAAAANTTAGLIRIGGRALPLLHPPPVYSLRIQPLPAPSPGQLGHHPVAAQPAVQPHVMVERPPRPRHQESVVDPAEA